MFLLLFIFFSISSPNAPPFPNATTLRLPRVFTKEAAEAAARPPARAPKPVAAPVELGLEVEDVKK